MEPGSQSKPLILISNLPLRVSCWNKRLCQFLLVFLFYHPIIVFSLANKVVLELSRVFAKASWKSWGKGRGLKWSNSFLVSKVLSQCIICITYFWIFQLLNSFTIMFQISEKKSKHGLLSKRRLKGVGLIRY